MESGEAAVVSLGGPSFVVVLLLAEDLDCEGEMKVHWAPALAALDNSGAAAAAAADAQEPAAISQIVPVQNTGTGLLVDRQDWTGLDWNASRESPQLLGEGKQLLMHSGSESR